MPLHTAVAHLTKSYLPRDASRWAQTEIVSHRGIPIAVAQTGDGQFFYTVLSLDPAAPDGASDADAWSTNPLPLPFPVESLAAGAEAVSLQAQPVLTREGKPPRKDQLVRLADRHPYLATTASLSEPGAPFNLVSDGIYLCLFRPSRTADGASATILMDRYNFDGKTLSLKLETRYQRSRLKGIPLNQKDTLGFEDLDKNPFHEPTHRLHHLVGKVSRGHFAVVLVPSLIPDEQNWQFFTFNDDATPRIRCISLPRGKDGLFDAQARSYYVSADPARHPEVFSMHPGDDPDGNPLVPWNGHGGKQRFTFRLPGYQPSCQGLHAAVYARQSTPTLAPGSGQGYSPVAKPLLGEQRLLLAVASRRSATADDKPNFIVLDFGVSRDGRLVHAAREKLIALEQAEPLKVHDMPDCDADMDALLANMRTLGTATDGTVNQGLADQMNKLHAQRAEKEKALGDLFAAHPELHLRWDQRATAKPPPTPLQTQLAQQQAQVDKLRADRSALESDYATRYSGPEHRVSLFNDKNPRPDQKADCSLVYSFPAFAKLVDGAGGKMVPAPKDYRLADDTYQFNDRASAARIDSDLIKVEFYRHFGRADSAPFDLMFTLSGGTKSDRFSDVLGDSNDALSGVRIRPDDKLATLLASHATLTTQINSASAEFDRLKREDDAIRDLIREPGGRVAQLVAENAALDAQIVAAQSQTASHTTLPMPRLVSYPNQQSNIAGGITAFAWSDHPPRLYRNADGRVSMYFLGAAGQYFVASLDVTVKADYPDATPTWLGGRPGRALALGDAGLKTQHQDAVTSPDRLTIEAWFRPTQHRRAFLFSHSDYVIRLEPDPEPGTSFGLQYNIHGKQGEVAPTIALDTWTHAAFVYRRAQGLRFTGTEHVDCGREKTLDIVRDLTIEVCLTADAGTKETRTVLHKGDYASAGGLIACALVLDSSLRVRWRYGATVAGGSARTLELDTGIQLQAGTPTRIAIVREYVVDQTLLNAELEKKKQAPAYEMNMGFAGFVHMFYQEGVLKHTTRDADATPTGGDGAFLLGANATYEAGYRGILADVRVWNKALAPSELHQNIAGARPGLVSWWPLDAREGYTAEDMKSGNHGTIVGAQWVADPDERASTLLVYINGQRMLVTPPGAPLQRPSQPLIIGGWQGYENVFSGEMEEIRLWARERSQAQIRDNLFRSLGDDRDGLLAYIDGEVSLHPGSSNGVELEDQSGNGCHVTTTLAQLSCSTAPIGSDAPLLRQAREGIDTPFACTIASTASATEYGAMQADAQGNGMGVLKRAYAFVSDERWHLLTGFKVGDLALEWIGQAQFDPQVVGFIEGAPPVPSENLTFEELDNYDGAASVKINEAQSTMYAIGSSSEKTAHMAIDMMVGLGVESESEVGLGAATSVEKLEISTGVRFSHESTTTTGNETQIGLGSNLSHASTMSLTGYWEAGAGQSLASGKRYMPQNVGCAVVQSETVDVFALRMKSTGTMVSRSIRKNPDIPRDWNIIVFPINPRYTKQGTLDGKVGLEADADYPAALNYSSDSSYFKPLEAYRWKRAIEQQAQVEREKYLQFGAQALGGLPRLHQRSIANTYVWTADGGLFAESTETIDSIEQASTGSLSWDVSAGVSADFKVMLGKAGPVGSCELMAGGGVTTTTMTSSSSETGFSVEVELNLETDIYARNTQEQVILDQGAPRKQSGKVDAYRFMSFYLAPDNTHLLELKNRVVDPRWLASDDSNARALSSALASAEARPWRIMHRVTFVSRVHEAPGTAHASSDDKLTLDETMINSNYELILALQPHIVGHLLDYAQFEQQVRAAVRDALPAYAGKVDDIVRLAGAYYGMFPPGAATVSAYAGAGRAASIQPGG